MSTGPNTSASSQSEPANTAPTALSDASSRGEPGSASVVLSAEQMHVATVRRPAHRVRVHREVITEEVMITVTVRREVLHVEQTAVDADAPPDSDGASALQAPAGLVATGSSSLEVMLSEERPVISLETVPYERVRLEVRQVATTTPVTADTRREVADITTDNMTADASRNSFDKSPAEA